MSVVTRADLEQASDQARSGLEGVQAGARQASNQITSFIADSETVLQGTGFDYVRQRLYLYQYALDKLCSLCDNLSNNITAANNLMINETKGLDLDTANIAELEERVSQIEKLIGWYSEMIVVDDEVPEEEREYVMRNEGMKNYYEGVLAIIKEELDLLKRLDSIAAGAASVLAPVSADINSFSNNVSSITPSSI
jgi:DNA repair ATPase RecN